MAERRLELPSTFEFAAYLTYDDVDGEITSVTGENASATRRYTLTARPAGRQPMTASWDPGQSRTDRIPRGRAKYASVEGGTLVFDGYLEITNTIVV